MRTTKVCSRCGKEKEIASFSKDKQHFTGYKSACKKCASGDFKRWREKNLEKVKRADRISHYQKAYGLSLDEAEKLVSDRIGVCPLCSNIKPLVVDHCHTTGRIRGYICSACNSTLGYAKDNITTLNNCISYLRVFYELPS